MPSEAIIRNALSASLLSDRVIRNQFCRKIIAGARKPVFKSRSYTKREKRVDLTIDIQKKLQEKEPAYARWATVYNLKQIAKSMFLLREHGVRTLDQLSVLTDETVKRRDELQAQMKDSERRFTEIAALKNHIINYSKTRNMYEEYRKAGYSKKFFETHREEITLHKAAKQAFDELCVRKIPKVKDLSAGYAEVLSSKKQAYAEFRKMRDEVQELLIAKQNIESLFEAEKQEKQKSRILEKSR